MPTFKVELRQAMERDGVPFRKWRNTFFVLGTNVGDAASRVKNDWETILRLAVRGHVYAYQVYATDLDPDSSLFSLQAIDTAFQRGDLGVGDEIYVPEECLAVTIGVSSSRPSRKFWRPGLIEGDFTKAVYSNSTLTTATITAFAALIATESYVDPQSEPWTEVLSVKQSNRELGRTAPFEVPAGPV